MVGMNYQHQQQYLKTKVETASPGVLTLLLYEEMYRKLKMAKINFLNNQVVEMLECIGRARSIMYELLGTLNYDYDISKNLQSLYQFYLAQLNEFVINRQPETLDSIIEFAKEFAETWKQAIQLVKSSKGS
ncbi:flagellar export chaperone FliS [Paenibacillus illinoisensis]|uniref:flagellar export chaperone FliS n=1 Tax=Paenibacillus illinoisensis TaxID=59845 RepID=UPI002041CD7C|nr:flagellar export chaperone FliS [Paenibacillus illinoisensis]MCM3208582.1 flagellar export chaperone FliS [Paenibacillus illinoisensis]